MFGALREGLEVLQAMEACGTNSGKPTAAVAITDCGVL
ncbi:MAG: hypothetical protein ACK53L_28290 [Pirellulaceae bacterium]